MLSDIFLQGKRGDMTAWLYEALLSLCPPHGLYRSASVLANSQFTAVYAP